MSDVDGALTRYKGWSLDSWELEYGAILTLVVSSPVDYPEDQQGRAKCIFSRLSRVCLSNFVHLSVIKDIEQHPKDNGVTLHRFILENGSFIEVESVQATHIGWRP